LTALEVRIAGSECLASSTGEEHPWVHEIRKHQERKERVMEIRLELERLVTRKVA
jgi:hypothetical protein